jgi:hypothetical protein
MYVVHATQENKKTRSVWGYPIVDTLMELRYFIPLLSYSKKARHRSRMEELCRNLIF